MLNCYCIKPATALRLRSGQASYNKIIFLPYQLFRNLSCQQLTGMIRKVPLKTEDIKYIRQAKKLLEENYAESVTIPWLAKNTGINQSKLKLGFKELYGTGIHAWLLNYRIEKAKTLLKNHSLSLEEIAYSIGYSHVTYFNSLFKKKTGITPGAWRSGEEKTSKKN